MLLSPTLPKQFYLRFDLFTLSNTIRQPMNIYWKTKSRQVSSLYLCLDVSHENRRLRSGIHAHPKIGIGRNSTPRNRKWRRILGRIKRWRWSSAREWFTDREVDTEVDEGMKNGKWKKLKQKNVNRTATNQINN